MAFSSIKTLGVMLASLVMGAYSAAAQTWPQRPITMIVSQPAGTSPDVMARLIGEKLSRSIGQPVVIENRPGAGNVLGATAAARATPDGHTVFFATSAALVTNPFMLKSLSYDTLKDFAPVAFVTRSHQLILINPALKANTLGELIALEKQNAGQFSIAIDGPRNLAGVTALALNKRAGTQFVLVPYPNTNAGLQDLIGGRIQAGVFSASISEKMVAAGTVRAVAVASTKRIEGLANVPAATETIPGFDYSGWFMVVAPAATPPDVIKTLNARIDEALKDSAVRELAPKLGFEIDPKGAGTPEQAAAFLREQMGVWERTTKDLGIEPQ